MLEMHGTTTVTLAIVSGLMKLHCYVPRILVAAVDQVWQVYFTKESKQFYFERYSFPFFY